MGSLGTQAGKTERATNQLGKTGKRTGTSLLNNLGGGASKVGGLLSKGLASVKNFAGGLFDMVKQLDLAKVVMIAMIAIGFVSWLNTASEATAKFNKELSNVATLIPGNEEDVVSLGHSIQQMSIESGKSMEDLTDAMYQVISAFPQLEDNADRLRVLDQAARAASAGMSTTEDAINLLSAVSKGYGDVSDEMLQKVSDLAFTTVQLGQTTFPELAAAIGKAVPLAAALGVEVEELFAAEATLTGVTGTAAEVTTQMRSALVALTKPTAEMRDLMERIGVKSGKEFIEAAGGIKGALELVTQDAQASGIELTKYFGRVEAVTAALALTGGQSEVFDQKFQAMNNSVGATSRAFREVTEGVNEYGYSVDQTARALDVLVESIGSVFLPIKSLLGDALRPFIIIFGHIFTIIGKVVSVIVRVIKFFGELGTTITGISGAVDGVSRTFEFFVNLLSTLDLYIKYVFAALRDKLAPVLEKVRTFFSNLFSPVVQLFNAFKEGVPEVSALEAALYTVEGALAALGTLFEVVAFPIKVVINLFKSLFEAAAAMGPVLENIVTFQWDKVGDSVAKVGAVFDEFGRMVDQDWTYMIDTIGEKWSGLSDRVEASVQEIQGIEAGPPLSGMADDLDLLGNAAEEALSPFEEVLKTMEDGLGTIERNALVFGQLGMEYDAVKESGDLYNKTLQSIMGNTEISAGQLQEFIESYGALGEAVRKADLSPLEEAFEKMNEGLGIVERNAALYEELGWEYDSVAESADVYNKVLESLLANGDITQEQLAAFIDMYEHLAEAQRQANEEIEKSPSLIDKFVAAMVTALNITEEEAKILKSVIEELANGLFNIAQQSYLDFFTNLGGALEDGSVSSEEWSEIIVEMGRNILRQLPMLFLQAGLQLIATPGMWPIGLGLIAAAGSTALISGYVDAKASQNAKGNVFQSGKIQAFGSGGVFDSPTFFPMANGGVGLMGEAGPEAIMPLSRGADGKLGVRTQGDSGGAQVRVVINNYSGQEVSQNETTGEDGVKQIEVTVGRIVKGQMSRGDYDATLKNRYGIKKAGYR